jgi:hypothetical protein
MSTMDSVHSTMPDLTIELRLLRCICPGMSSAPVTAPLPNAAERRPKPPADRPSWSRAITGSSAQNALAHTAKVRLRMTNARMTAECRANRRPLITPESTVSGTPGSLRSRGAQRRIAITIGTKQNALARSALPVPIHAAIAPASAGPTARATLNATEPSATARDRSARETSSLMLACCAGV